MILERVYRVFSMISLFLGTLARKPQVEWRQNNVPICRFYILSTSLAGVFPSRLQVQQSSHNQIHVLPNLPHLPDDAAIPSRDITYT